MRYRSLGPSPLTVSEIGFGCMSLQGTEPDMIGLLQHAVAKGINFFDTADLYNKGGNEIIVGKALKQLRHTVIIATKVGNVWKEDGSGWEWKPTKKYILAAAAKSLQRLQTDYIDLYQLHGGTLADPIDEIIEAFELLQQQGKIRCYGISSIRPNVIREYVHRSHIVSVMMQYSLLDRRPEESVMKLLDEKNISILARGTLAKGLLVNKPATAYLDYNIDDVRTMINKITSTATNKRSPTQTAIQFVLKHKTIASAITGIRTKEQLEDILTAIDAPELTDSEMKILGNIIPLNFYQEHR